MVQPVNDTPTLDQHPDLHKLEFPTTWKKFYCDPNGFDSYDGLSPRFPKPKIQDILTLASGMGELHVGPGTYSPVDTLTFPMAVKFIGYSWQGGASGGVVINDTNLPDDGRPLIRTSASASADATKFVFGNAYLLSSGAKTGGGAAFEGRNLQNGFWIHDVHMAGPWSGPTFWIYDSITNSVNFPGFGKCERVWMNGGDYNLLLESGTTGIEFDTCGFEVNANVGSLAVIYLKAKDNGAPVTITAAIEAGGTVTITAAGHGCVAGTPVMIAGVTPVGYNGMYRVASVSGNDFTYVCDTTGLAAGSVFGTVQKKHGSGRGEVTFRNCKTEGADNDIPWMIAETQQRVGLDGVSVRKPSGAGSTKPMIQWDGPLYDDNGIKLLGPPISSRNTQNANRPYHVVAARFGGDNTSLTIPALDWGGGRPVRFEYPGHVTTPYIDIPEGPVPPNPPAGIRRLFVDAATGKLSARTSAGTTVLLEP